MRLEDLEGGPFDVVILNSVVQYFPDVDYLVRVLERSRGARSGKVAQSSSVTSAISACWKPSTHPSSFHARLPDCRCANCANG